MDKNKMKKILFINFITMATFNMAHPVTPSLINALSMPTYMFGVLYSTMSIAHFVMSPIWGSMSDQKGRKRFLVIGVIGYGLGKAGEVTAAISKGVESAKKNLYKVPVVHGTVPHAQSAHFGGSKVLLMPASEGTGVVAGGAMRAVLESVGITDVLAKSQGSSNAHNLVKATVLALSEMRDARQVAQARGISMEKVFRG